MKSVVKVLSRAIAVFLAFTASQALAVKANPKPVTRYQPDGTSLEVVMVGDERVVFEETKDGLTLVQDNDGWWVYADPASHGQAALRPTNLRAGKDDPPAMWSKHARPSIDADALPIPFRQQDDGSIGDLFRAQGHGRSAGRTALAANMTPTSVPVLVILVEFADWAHTSAAGTPRAGEPNYQPIAGQSNASPTWQTLFNDKTVPGGLNHFYNEASYGWFQWNVKVAQRGKGPNGTGTLVNDGWYVNPNTMASWGGDKKGAGPSGGCTHDGGTAIKGLITWAVQAADADVNFAQFDTDGNGTISDAELMVFVVHAREGQENYGDGCGTAPADPLNDHIWSHKWNMAANVSVDGKTIPSGHIYAIEPEFSPVFNYATNPWTLTEKYFGVGVYAHESLHTLGAPDIYDTGYDAVPAGEWDLMDSGSYNGAKSGTHPAHMGGPLKQDIKLNADSAATSYGFIPDSAVVNGTLSEGVKSIAGTGGGSYDNVLHRLVAPNNANEWFLIENRAAVGYYEPYLPEHGLVIWHRDLSASGSGNNSWPYQAAVLRKGWANTASGLNAGELGAALSLEDGETVFTATSDPNNKLNNGSASGLKDIRCIGAEGSLMSYGYGAVSGSHVGYAGNSVSGGDNDPWIDNGENTVLTVKVQNSSCASASASGVAIAISVAADSEIPAGQVSITPSIQSLGTIAAGTTLNAAFTVQLNCTSCAGKTLKLAYTISGTGFADVTGSFTKDTNQNYLFLDAADGTVPGWSSTSSLNPSACASASGHGNWTLSTLAGSPYGTSYRTPVTGGVTYANPSEVWVSPNITIPAGTNLRELTFSHAAQIPCSGYSRARLWVSTNDGASWTRWDAFYKDAGDLSWEQVALDMSSLNGATQVRFMFALYTYTCQTGCSATAGWYLDNIGLVVDQAAGGPPSNTAPSVTISAPGNGSSFTQGTSVSFTGSASDTEDGTLTGSLAWTSSLNGAIGSGGSFSTSSLSVGTHTITASVTDSGSLTGSASITVTITSLSNTAPTVSISAPGNGSSFTQGASVTFTGSANDAEQGSLGGSLSWTSSINGSIGSGASFSTSSLSVGTHTITASVTDNGGLTGSASITVTINAPTGDVTPPVISGVTSVITNSKNGSFEVRWTTNEPSTTVVTIGTTNYSDTALVTSHVKSFRGTKGATYTYSVSSTDAAGNTGTAGPFTHQN